MAGIAVHIEQLPVMRVARFHAEGMEPEHVAWEHLRSWAEPRGLLADAQAHPIFGFNNPPPKPERGDYGYELWIGLGPPATAAAAVAGSPVATHDFPGAWYVVARQHGPPTPEVWKQLWDEARNCGLRHRRHQELERLLNPLAPEVEWEFDLYLPIEAPADPPDSTTTTRSDPSFLPPPLPDADPWSRWIAGKWEGSGSSETGKGTGMERFEFALNGQFLVSHGEARITEMTPDQAEYLRRNMHATDEEIARFRAEPYRSLEIFTIDPATGDVLGFSFDSLRCIATGRGRREGDREIVEWKWTNGHASTRITDRVADDRMVITQCTRMPDGSVMEEKGEARRRSPAAREAACASRSPEVTAVEAFVASINARDVEAMSKLMTDDHTFIDSAGTSVSGRATMLAGWRDYWAMFPDFRINIDTVLQDGPTVVVFGQWSATYAGQRGLVSENAVGSPAVWRAVVEHARIKSWQVWADNTRTIEVIKHAAESTAAEAP